MTAAPLTRVEISRFRGIKHCVLEDLKPINVLIGRCGSGKSSVLEAVYFAAGLSRSIEGVVKSSISPTDVERYHAPSPPSLHPIVSLPVDLAHGIAVNEYLVKRRESATARQLLFRYDGECSLKLEGKGFENYARAGRGCDEALALHENRVGGALHAELIDAAALRAGPVYAHWRAIVEKALDDRLASLISKVYDRKIARFTGVPSRAGRTVDVVAVMEDGQRLYLEDLSDGAKTVFAVGVISSLMNSPSVLLLEEPEAHLHPTAQRELCCLLAESAKLGRQVIVSTHSAEFAKLLLEESGGLEVTIFHLERDPDGSIYVRSVSRPDARVLEDLGVDIRFLDAL